MESPLKAFLAATVRRKRPWWRKPLLIVPLIILIPMATVVFFVALYAILIVWLFTEAYRATEDPHERDDKGTDNT